MSTPYGSCEDGGYQPRPAAPATAWPDPGRSRRPQAAGQPPGGLAALL